MKNRLSEMFGSDEAMGVVFDVDGYDEPISPERLNELFAGLRKEEMPEFRSVFHDGLDAICCTNYAIQVAKALPGRTRIVGFANEDNPTSRVAREEIHPGGHDFAIVDGRYLVDPWIKLVAAEGEQIVFDLADPADAAAALDIYGPRECWESMDIALSESEGMVGEANVRYEEWEAVPDPAGRGRGWTAVRLGEDDDGQFEEWSGQFFPTAEECRQAVRAMNDRSVSTDSAMEADGNPDRRPRPR